MTQRAADRPPAAPKGLHIPPEDAAYLVMLLLEVAANLWQQERRKWATRRMTLTENLEYALGHEGGFTTIMRRSRSKRRSRRAVTHHG